MVTRRFVVGSLLALVVTGVFGTASAQDSERFFVVGFVKSPGAFVLNPGMTVEDGIAVAGGLTERGTLSRIQVARMVNGERQTLTVALADKLQANDTIRVFQKID